MKEPIIRATFTSQIWARDTRDTVVTIINWIHIKIGDRLSL